MLGLMSKIVTLKLTGRSTKFEHVESFLKQRYDTLSTRSDAFSQLGGIFK